MVTFGQKHAAIISLQQNLGWIWQGQAEIVQDGQQETEVKGYFFRINAERFHKTELPSFSLFPSEEVEALIAAINEPDQNVLQE